MNAESDLVVPSKAEDVFGEFLWVPPTRLGNSSDSKYYDRTVNAIYDLYAQIDESLQEHGLALWMESVVSGLGEHEHLSQFVYVKHGSDYVYKWEFEFKESAKYEGHYISMPTFMFIDFLIGVAETIRRFRPEDVDGRYLDVSSVTASVAKDGSALPRVLDAADSYLAHECGRWRGNSHHNPHYLYTGGGSDD